MNTLYSKSLIALLAPLAFGAATSLASAQEQFPAGLVEQGKYLATASDCVACHTTKGGKPMAGGLNISSPVGTIVSTNITPSKQFGIGSYTEQQFADAVRRGIRPDGANLYPAMPYTSYNLLTDADIHALYAYFMQDVAPVEQPTAETDLPFPMNIRFSLKIWNILFLNSKPLTDDPKQSAEWNRGRYLSEGAAHCSTCHTPRGMQMQELADRPLSGAQVGPWFAPDITSDKANGIGSWTRDELATYLKTGRVEGKAQAAGSMAEAITHSFHHMKDADLQAISTYIKSVPASGVKTDHAATETRFDQGKAANELAHFRGDGFDAGMSGKSAGAQIFSANCSSCHGYDGQGTSDGYYPSIFNNSATAGDNPNNLLATILYGVERETDDGHVFMPPFGDQPNAVTSLNNDEIASLANYVLKSYGNSSLTVLPQDVQVIRDGGPTSSLVLFARLGLGAGATGAAIVLVGLLLLYARKRRQRHGSPQAA
jgi:mono/diheme cytochrome c family protein